MWNRNKQYKDLFKMIGHDGVVEKLLTHVPECRDKEKLVFWLCNLHQCRICSGWTEDEFNELLRKYKIDISQYEEGDRSVDDNGNFIGYRKSKVNFDKQVLEAIPFHKYKKKPLLAYLRTQFPNEKGDRIRRAVSRLLEKRIIEIDKTYKTKPIVVKGYYYNTSLL